jgi:mRNA interferase HigB
VLIVGIEVLIAAVTRYPDARTAIENWQAITTDALWRSLHEVRLTYPHADGVTLSSGTVVTVFNIRGNKYRLLTVISYPAQIVSVRFFLTHAEYDKEKWKRQL